jgi:deoxyadenosine/deoxycytidine kinase
MLVDDGSIDRLEFAIYQRLFRQLRSSCTSVAGIIHVNTPPTLCLDRIRSRGRGGEDVIPLAYLDNLSRFQKSWLAKTNVPVLHTDGNSVEEASRFLDSLAISIPDR